MENEFPQLSNPESAPLTVEELARWAEDENLKLSNALCAVEIAVGLRDKETGARVATYPTPMPRGEVELWLIEVRVANEKLDLWVEIGVTFETREEAEQGLRYRRRRWPQGIRVARYVRDAIQPAQEPV